MVAITDSLRLSLVLCQDSHQGSKVELRGADVDEVPSRGVNGPGR